MKKLIQVFTVIAAMMVNEKIHAQTCTANAGPDQVICCPGGGVTLGAPDTAQITSCPCGTVNIKYLWGPAQGLSNNHIRNPIASPTVTTVYKLCVRTYSAAGCNTLCCQACDSVTVTVNGSCCSFSNPFNEKINKITYKADHGLLYPNPSSGDVTLELNEAVKNAEVNIYDVTGKLIWQKKNLSDRIKLNINTSAYPKGVYFIKVIDSNSEIYSNKIVLE